MLCVEESGGSARYHRVRVLQYVAMCCSVVQRGAARCSVLHCVEESGGSARYHRVCVLQCVAVWCSVLQRGAARCSVLHCV